MLKLGKRGVEIFNVSGCGHPRKYLSFLHTLQSNRIIRDIGIHSNLGATNEQSWLRVIIVFSQDVILNFNLIYYLHPIEHNKEYPKTDRDQIR